MVSNFLILLSLDVTETIIILPSSYFWNLDKLIITQVPREIVNGLQNTLIWGVYLPFLSLKSLPLPFYT